MSIMATKLYNLLELLEVRRQLRKNITEAELVLWEVLKNKKLRKRKFRRQHSIGYYIVDIYCSAERLIIELDGQHHYTPENKAKDKERDTHLALMGFKILRFENKMVLNNLTEVLKIIIANFAN